MKVFTISQVLNIEGQVHCTGSSLKLHPYTIRLSQTIAFIGKGEGTVGSVQYLYRRRKGIYNTMGVQVGLW